MSRCHGTAQRRSQVTKSRLFAPFCTKNDNVVKPGSGQTQGKLKNKHAFSYTAEAKFEEVFLGDQLRMMREAGEVLAGFTEATPEFAPILDGLGAHWPSRVLYHTQAGYGQHLFYTVLY